MMVTSGAYLDARCALQQLSEVLQLALASCFLFSTFAPLALLHVLNKHLLPVHRSNCLQQTQSGKTAAQCPDDTNAAVV